MYELFPLPLDLLPQGRRGQISFLLPGEGMDTMPFKMALKSHLPSICEGEVDI